MTKTNNFKSTTCEVSSHLHWNSVFPPFLPLSEILFEVVLTPRWEKSSESLLAALQHPRGRALFGLQESLLAGVKFQPQKGGSKVALRGPHANTMTSQPLFFALHSNTLCCSDNGWHRHNCGDFGGNNNWNFQLRVRRRAELLAFCQLQADLELCTSFLRENKTIFSILPQFWPKLELCEFHSCSVVGNVLHTQPESELINQIRDNVSVSSRESDFCPEKASLL